MGAKMYGKKHWDKVMDSESLTSPPTPKILTFKPLRTEKEAVKNTAKSLRIKLAETWKLLSKDFGKMEHSWSEMLGTCPYPPQENNCNLRKNLKTLYAFRNDLFDYIDTYVCSSPYRSSCERIGSLNYSSDIDVSITFGDESEDAELWKLGSLNSIKVFLVEFFKKDIGTISRFFDMNFYLTGYAITHDTRNIDFQKVDSENKTINLSDYVISTSPEQLKYAFFELTYQDETAKKEKPVVSSEDYNELVALISNLKRGYKEASNDDKATKGNHVIDAISQLSTAEDETYHTQGSYFHVVLQMQKKYNIAYDETTVNKMLHLLRNSFVENLCFAYTHHEKGKSPKYLNRVIDAWERMRTVYASLGANSPKNPFNPGPDYTFKRVSEIRLDYNAPLSFFALSYFKQIYDQLKESSTKINKEGLHKQIALYFDSIKKYVQPPEQPHGGSGILKQTSIKKHIQGVGERVVYVDASRKQYIKVKGEFIRLAKARKQK